jgi:aminoglycoside phosphotransferase (APT) family kinase protein
MHDAARSFVAPDGAVWDFANLPPAGPGSIVCHNDLCVENVVVRDGRAVAFIDFDFAAPTDPLLDIAIACRHWVPFRDPLDVPPEWAGIDQSARFVRFSGEYGLSAVQRTAVVDHGLAFLDRALVSMRARAATNDLYRAAWDAGYPEQNRRSHAWLTRFDVSPAV